ncbi:MAG: hypothetical protein IKV57_00245 [Clostridia bacterium]|nr:hypothetical protein [Clostridia bacterium]
MHFVIAGQTGVGTSELAQRMNSLAGSENDTEYTAVVFDDVTEEEVSLPSCDGVIIAVNLLDGPMPGTREGIRRAWLGKVPVVGIALTHLDQFLAQTQIRHSIRELVGWETRGLLSQYGYTDDTVPLAELGLVAGCDDSVAAFRDAVLAYMQK